MIFRKRPLVGTVRRRFLWLPKRVTLFKALWLATGEDPVPFMPGGLGGGFTAPTPLGGGNRQVRRPTGGGMYTPVRYEQVNVRDEWAWLEYWLESVQVYQDYGQPQVRTAWFSFLPPEQLMLWNEYDI